MLCLKIREKIKPISNLFSNTYTAFSEWLSFNKNSLGTFLNRPLRRMGWITDLFYIEEGKIGKNVRFVCSK